MVIILALETERHHPLDIVVALAPQFTYVKGLYQGTLTITDSLNYHLSWFPQTLQLMILLRLRS
jgi:hypothetical protein